MRRLLVCLTAFLLATGVGMTVGLVATPSAAALGCEWDLANPILRWECYGIECLGERYPHAVFSCGTDSFSGLPCGCYWIGCSKWCVEEE